MGRPGGQRWEPGAVHGTTWTLTLPADPDLRRSEMGGGELWLAGQGDRLRGLYIGQRDLGEGVTLESAAAQLRLSLA